MCRLPFHKMIRRCVIFCVLFVCFVVRKVRDTFSGKLVCPARIVCVRCEGGMCTVLRSAGNSMLSTQFMLRGAGMSNGIMYVINVDLYEGLRVLCEAFSSLVG